MKEKLQRFGQVMLIPISVITIGSLFMGLGSAFTGEATLRALNLWGAIHPGTGLFSFFSLMQATGGLVFNNLAIFFAVGCAFGLAKREKGWAAFSGLIAFIAMHTLINQMFTLHNISVDTVSVQYLMDHLNYSQLHAIRYNSLFNMESGIFSYRLGIFGGLLAGLLAAWLHNRLWNVKLPVYLEFFAGTRAVPIASLVCGALLGVLLYYVWPPIGYALTNLGLFINRSGLVGTFVWACLDKGLLPFGLHNLITTPLRLTELGGQMTIDGHVFSGTTNIYMAQIASNDNLKFLVRGFQSGRIPLHFGALPGAALAMYVTARKENRKRVAGLLIPAVLTMVLFGVTEPLEFTFLFVAPWLFWLVHVPLTGIIFVVTEFFKVSVYGASVKDILPVLFQPNKLYVTPYLFIIPICFVVYFYVFRYLILRFNVQTPGRELAADSGDIRLFTKKDYKEKESEKKAKGDDALAGAGPVAMADAETTKDDNDALTLAQQIVEALGGKDNVDTVEYCMTRLRVHTNDGSKVADRNIWMEKLGANGIVKNGDSIQVIYGTKVPMIAGDVREELGLD